MIDDFVDAVREDREPVCDGPTGFRVQATVDAYGTVNVLVNDADPLPPVKQVNLGKTVPINNYVTPRRLIQS